MQTVKLSSILSVSSEDSNYPACNLLSSDTFRKWSCRIDRSGKSMCDGQCVVIVELERPSEICRIDIGNNGSAFVEIFGGRACEPDNFQSLLPASMLMSPTESRDQSNPNRVRMFNDCDLSSRGEKYDRLKIVCSQNFNKDAPFGLSFIKLMAKNNSKEVIFLFFFLRLFVSFSVPSATGVNEFIVEEKSTERIRPGSFFKMNSGNQSPTMDVEPSEKRTKIEKPEEPIDSQHFSEILVGCKFSLSGYENPRRAEIRDKAVQMGAQYFPKWTQFCTHLICAFPNTPKYEEAHRNGGIIVSEKWILDCERMKRKLDTEKYLVQRNVQRRNDPEINRMDNADNRCIKFPNVFKDERIFLATDLSEADKRECRRLIAAFGGSVSGILDEETTTIVADSSDWLNENEGIKKNGVEIVSIEWLQECHDSECKADKTIFKLN
ncbi:hypothetical protein ACOME3_006112 [Neoechinorhynchus agilis]